MTDWFDNDALFAQELREGHLWAGRLADVLRGEGLSVELTPMAFRASIEERLKFANEGDLMVNTAERPVLLESKSRNLHFTAAADYPYPTALVDTVAGWEQKTDKPAAIVLTSQRTAARLVISIRRTRHLWRKCSRYDVKRQITDGFYEVPTLELLPFDVLVDWLKSLGQPT